MRSTLRILLLPILLAFLCIAPGCATEPNVPPETRKRAAMQEMQDWWTGFWKVVLLAGTMYGQGTTGAAPYDSDR